MALLRTNYSKLHTHIFPIDADQVVIGRQPDCAIVLNFAAVSRCHAMITRSGAEYTITDLGSRNGTRLNGEPLKKSAPLRDGDRVTIGEIEFLFDSEQRTRPLSDTGTKFDSAILTDDDIRQPINVTSQIDFRSLRGPLTMPTTLEDSKKQILNLQHKITAITELMRTLSQGSSSQDLMSQFLGNVLKLFTYADFACILKQDPATGELELLDFKARDTSCQYRISRSVSSYVFENNAAILSENLSSDDRFEPSESIIRSRISSIMAVPIPDPVTQKPSGVIQVDSRTSGRRFSNADLDLLFTIANQLAMHHELVRFQEVQREEALRSKEMELAKQVQKGFLPTSLPEVDGYEFFHIYKPMDVIGGDFYDYIPLPDGRQAVLVADVSGHGISGALVTAKLSSEARFFLLSEPSLPKVMAKINTSIHENFGEVKHVTMALIVIDPQNQRFSLLNAAHVYPFRKRGEQVDIIGDDHHGFPIGWLPDAEYEDYSFEMEPGDFLVLMTDGITEAKSPEDEEFGMEGVRKYLAGAPAESVQRLGEGLLDAVRQHTGPGKQEDDQCVVVFKRLA